MTMDSVRAQFCEIHFVGVQGVMLIVAINAVDIVKEVYKKNIKHAPTTLY